MSSVGITSPLVDVSISGPRGLSCACLAGVLSGGMYALAGRSSRNLSEEAGMVGNEFRRAFQDVKGSNYISWTLLVLFDSHG